MDAETLRQLNGFIGRASKATYASGGGKVESWRKGFDELEYTENDWYYRDSYTGFLRSWGQEVVWLYGKPVWSCLYGGGMSESKLEGTFAEETFRFLQKVLSSGDKETAFQPRGPKLLEDGEWRYECEVGGAIEKFAGRESIRYRGEVVFTHEFFGGLVIT